jgi:undecaprenyl pyrophosphate phosphatase UppP
LVQNPGMKRQNDESKYWSKLALFVVLALLPVVGIGLLLAAIYARGPVAFLLVVAGALLILALPVGKFMLFPNTTLEHMYRGWILRRIHKS